MILDTSKDCVLFKLGFAYASILYRVGANRQISIFRVSKNLSDGTWTVVRLSDDVPVDRTASLESVEEKMKRGYYKFSMGE